MSRLRQSQFVAGGLAHIAVGHHMLNGRLTGHRRQLSIVVNLALRLRAREFTVNFCFLRTARERRRLVGSRPHLVALRRLNCVLLVCQQGTEVFVEILRTSSGDRIVADSHAYVRDALQVRRLRVLTHLELSFSLIDHADPILAEHILMLVFVFNRGLLGIERAH